MNIKIKHKFAPKFFIDLTFEISEESFKETKTAKLHHADGYDDAGVLKFRSIAHLDKSTGDFIKFEKIKDIFDRQWITENSLSIISQYDAGVLTLRGLHYQLVGLGMINHMRLYKRAVSAMIEARRNQEVAYDTFSDNDRGMIGKTVIDETDVEDSIDRAKEAIENWVTIYYKNKWENQKYYVEVFIEKKALQNVFQVPCRRDEVALGACKGYPSLTFLYEASERFKDAELEGKTPVIIYFGDYDPSGEDIPRSIQDNLYNDFGVDVTVDRVALMEDQVVEWGLPPAPIKDGDSRSGNWDGLGQVELDAVKPEKLQRMCRDAIGKYFDQQLHDELIEKEKAERTHYISTLKDYVNNLTFSDDDESDD